MPLSMRSLVSLVAVSFGTVALVGCAPKSEKLTVHMYELRGEGDKRFIDTVLEQEKLQNNVNSKSEVTKDKVATVTTTERAHLKLRRELNVRVSDQWPYNWRSDDF